MLPMLLIAALIPGSAPKSSPSCCGNMAMFLTDSSFFAAHERPLPFKFRSNEGKTVSFSGPDGTHSGYFVAPSSSGTASKTAIVMVHEWWGLNDYIKQEAVRLHDSTGYAVLAVDLYHGKVASAADEAGKLMGSVNEDEATATVKDAVDALESGTFGQSFTQLGTVGWCFGGGWSLRTAIQGGSHVKACVMYYGMPDDSPEDLQKLKAPVLMFEALKDQWITPEVVSKFEAAMKDAGKQLTVKTYDQDHAFANPSNPHYSKQDTADSVDRMLKFFKRNLG